VLFTSLPGHTFTEQNLVYTCTIENYLPENVLLNEEIYSLLYIYIYVYALGLFYIP